MPQKTSPRSSLPWIAGFCLLAVLNLAGSQLYQAFMPATNRPLVDSELPGSFNVPPSSAINSAGGIDALTATDEFLMAEEQLAIP